MENCFIEYLNIQCPGNFQKCFNHVSVRLLSENYFSSDEMPGALCNPFSLCLEELSAYCNSCKSLGTNSWICSTLQCQTQSPNGQERRGWIPVVSASVLSHIGIRCITVVLDTAGVKLLSLQEINCEEPLYNHRMKEYNRHSPVSRS